jgi:hypothetical protein
MDSYWADLRKTLWILMDINGVLGFVHFDEMIFYDIGWERSVDDLP